MRVDEPMLSICGDLAQRLEPFGRERSQGAPGSLELVEFRQQGKQFRSDANGVSS